MQPLAVSAWTLTSALGAGRAATLDALRSERGGLAPNDFPNVGLDTWIGRVAGLEEQPLSGDFAAWDCRNHRLANLGIEQDDFAAAVAGARERYGADKVGVFVGTSTSGIGATERAYRERNAEGELPDWFDYEHSHEMHALAGFLRARLGLAGPTLAVSTACSSSAKAFATARRYMQAGLCRAAVAGGVDTLCAMTLYGFHSLQLLSSKPCRPADAERDGINLGEAAGFALLEWPPEAPSARLQLLGYGESSDAHHMSAPHPDGLGAKLAMRDALSRAALEPGDIDWVHLHGTGTPANDLAEDKAVTDLFGAGMACSSTKGWTGHTLGAAGIVNFALGALAIEEGFLPASLNTRKVDAALAGDIVMENRTAPPRRVLANAFGFGGNNASLVLGAAE
ncbi:MAG: beta-ketoacyl-[acyl-carrier-protein] synthase family protein [Gammaproteobacteria bacterium]|nr:beta-ketoacyl-[acyl-carrier-protein] synthase family protein [Gammaproteobacteria bacterium]